MSLTRLLVSGIFAVVFCSLLSSTSYGQPQTISHANGKARWQYQYKDGSPEGEALQFYVDGSLMVRGSFQEGLKHGLFSYYGKNGELLERALYVHGKREWRSLDTAASDAPPMQLLSAERKPELRPATSKLERFTHPFLLVIPFSSLDRLSKRMGLAVGTSTEDGELRGRRGEFFVNKMKGRYGVHTSVALSMTKAPVEANLGDKFTLEQLSLAAVGSYRVVDRVKHLGFLRAGFSRSFGLEASKATPVRGVSAGQRPSDFAATFAEASVFRASANHFYMREHFLSQVDVGIDAAHYTETLADESQNDLILRMNAGAATGTDSWKFALETANALNLTGPSLFTVGTTVTYYSGSNSWTTLNLTMDHHGEASLLVSTGSWLWR